MAERTRDGYRYAWQGLNAFGRFLLVASIVITATGIVSIVRRYPSASYWDDFCAAIIIVVLVTYCDSVIRPFFVDLARDYHEDK